MRRRARLMLAASALAVIGCQDATRPDDVEGPLLSQAQGQVVPDRYIVLFTDQVADPASAARGLARAHGLTLRHVYGTAVKGFAGTIPAARLDAVRSDPQVVLVEPERAYELDVQQVLPTGIDRIEADLRNAGGVTVLQDVGMLDTGIDQDHPDLNVVGGINFSGGPSSKWDDGNGHGTHTAGTVGAIDNDIGVVGVAPGVRLHAVKVCKNGGICLTGDMIAGIDWMAARKADGSIDFAAANMSISTSDDKDACTVSSGAVHQAICGLVNTGVVFALSAGNNNRKKDAFPEVLAVSAIADFDGKGGGAASAACSDIDDTRADFSNFGPEVDIAAPGVCILSTWNDGGTNTISGTSMAAPHVAGAVALYLHAHGLDAATNAAGVDAIEAAIIGAALPQDDLCGYVNDEAGQSLEPLLFVNALTGNPDSDHDGFHGGGSCDLASTEPVHDVAVTAVSASPSPATQGDDVTITVTVTNEGDFTESFDVTVTESPDGADLDALTATNLKSGLSTDLTFTWTTTNATSTGDHTLTATADAVAGETDTADNSDFTTVTINAPTEGVTVTSIVPNTMPAGTAIDVTITGSGFAGGATVTLENGSGPAPTASSVVVDDANTITATITAKSGGPPRDRLWDVRVTNSDGSFGVLVGKFTVTP